MSSLTPPRDSSKPIPPGDRVAEFYLLGKVAWDDVMRLQRRLVYEVGGDNRQRLHILLCEHPDILTIGRAGSRQHVRFTDEELRHERIAIRWVGRGGGCVLHTPGQICIYPIMSLANLRWNVGEFMQRFQSGMRQALTNLGVCPRDYEGQYSLAGRAGVLMAMGAAVQNWITCHGAFVNVCPAMPRFSRIESLDSARIGPGDKATMTSLLAERRQAVRMASVRSELVASLADSFECPRHHIYTQHPLLSAEFEGSRESIARAS